MSKSVSAVLLLLTSVVQAEQATVWEDMGDKMEFAYLIARHGARSAYFRNPENNLLGLTGNEANGRLTPQGMRQCYLRGRWNIERYSHQYDLISSSQGGDGYTPGQIYVHSTPVERVI